MKHLLRCLLGTVLFAVSLPAATVTGYVGRVSYNAATTKVLFEPRTVPQTVAGRTYLPGVVSTSPTNGLLAVKLLGGRYQVTFDPPAGVLSNFIVPDGDGIYSFADLLTNLTTYTYTNEPLTRPSARILIGTNLVAITNNWGLPNESLTINATSSGGGSMDYTVTNSLASTNYVVAATNSLNTTLRAALAQTNATALTNGSNAFYWDASGGTWYSPNPVTFADLGGEGSGLTNLNADYITLGTLAEARIAASIARDTEVQDATNSLNTALRSALAQTNITSANVTAALGFTPLTALQATNAAAQQAQYATNTLDAALRAALAQTNVYNGIAFTNIAASNIVSGGQLGMGVVAAGISNIAGPFLTTNTFSRYYSWNGGALTNVTAASMTNGVVSGLLVYSGTTNYAASTWTNTATGNSVTITNGTMTLISNGVANVTITPSGTNIIRTPMEIGTSVGRVFMWSFGNAGYIASVPANGPSSAGGRIRFPNDFPNTISFQRGSDGAFSTDVDCSTGNWTYGGNLTGASSTANFNNIIARTTVTATNGFVATSLSNSPPAVTSLMVGGAALWSDGTNLCVIIKNHATGTLTTNKVTMTAWP